MKTLEQTCGSGWLLACVIFVNYFVSRENRIKIKRVDLEKINFDNTASQYQIFRTHWKEIHFFGAEIRKSFLKFQKWLTSIFPHSDRRQKKKAVKVNQILFLMKDYFLKCILDTFQVDQYFAGRVLSMCNEPRLHWH